MLYDPSHSDSSGGSWAYSEKFFDFDDCPPWDTWVAFIPKGDYLICWIPEIFFPIAERGMEASPMQCLDWIDGPYYGETPILRILHQQWQEAAP